MFVGFTTTATVSQNLLAGRAILEASVTDNFLDDSAFTINPRKDAPYFMAASTSFLQVRPHILTFVIITHNL
jgi:hypothetical protein